MRSVVRTGRADARERTAINVLYDVSRMPDEYFRVVLIYAEIVDYIYLRNVIDV